MKAKLLVAIIALTGLAATSADAQTIRGKARHERQSIEKGYRSGQITKGEAYRLGREQTRMHREMNWARRNDGHIGPRERHHIRRHERRAHRHLFWAKHNRRMRY